MPVTCETGHKYKNANIKFHKEIKINVQLLWFYHRPIRKYTANGRLVLYNYKTLKENK